MELLRTLQVPTNTYIKGCVDHIARVAVHRPVLVEHGMIRCLLPKNKTVGPGMDGAVAF